MNDSSSSLARLLYRTFKADAPALVWLRRFLVALVCIAGLASIVYSAQSLFYPYVYMKDFIQEYLLARAVLAGVMPYLSISDLAQQFIGPLPNAVFPHPTPHLPPVAILVLPLGLLEYQQAAVVWFVFEIGCVLIAVYLLLNWLDLNARPWIVLLNTLAVFTWNPFMVELVWGQLAALLLVILLLSWHALRANRSVQGGVFLGMAISLKLIGWPIVLFLAARKNWRAVAASIVTVIVLNGVATLLMGYEAILYYYSQVGSLVGSLHRADAYNFSLWSVGWRLFDGTGSSVMVGVQSPPVFASPILARGVAVALPLLLVIVGIALAYRARNFSNAFAIMVCIGILANPVAWNHYFVLLIFPLYVIGYQLWGQRFPKAATYVALFCGLLLFIPREQWLNLAMLIGKQAADGKVIVNPWVLTVLTMLPAVLVLMLIWLLHRLDGRMCLQSESDIDED